MDTSLFDQIPVAILELSARGEITAATPSFAAIVGRELSFASGPRRHIAEFVHAEDAALLDPAIEGARLGIPQRGSVSLRLLHGDGRSIGVDIMCRAHGSGGGPPTSLLCVVLPHSNATAKPDNGLDAPDGFRTLQRTLAGVAHEINNPLASIAGYAHSLLRNATDEQRLSLEAIAREVRRAGQLTKDMLAVARSGYRSQPDRVDLNAVVGRVALPRTEHGVSVTVDHVLTTEVPLVFGLTASLERIVASLTQAAQVRTADAAQPGKACRVRVSTAVEDATVVLRVEDDGVTLSKSEADAIWVPFGTAQDTSPISGLDLPVVHRAVTQQGGTIAVHPGATRGNVVVVMWPRAAQRDSRWEGPIRARGPLDVLVVDDETAIRELLREYLSLRGHAVIAVESGAEALRAAERQGFDAVITDLLMPGPDGIEVLRSLRAMDHNRSTRMVIATGDLDIASGDPALGELSDVHVVHKPYDVDALARLIERP